MRILLIPLYYNKHAQDSTLFDGMVEAFSLNNEAMMYYGDVKRAIDFKPDLIVFQGSVSLVECKEIKDKTGALFTMYTGDCRFAPMQVLMDYRSIVDIYLLPFTGELLKTHELLLEKPCKFIWEAIQNWRFKELKPLDSGQITFVGNAYEHVPSDRIELSNFLTKHIPDFVCYGSISNSKGEIDFREVPELYRNSYCVIAESNWYVESYFSQRNTGAMAVGSCVLMSWFPKIEEHFTNWKDCVIYKDKFELLDIINFLKANPEARNRIAATGHELARTKFTYKNWANEYLKQIK